MADQQRPSRAKMNNWLAMRLRGLTRIVPANPADIGELARRARAAESDIRALAEIASELGWHADASLDNAWELIGEYDERKGSS